MIWLVTKFADQITSVLNKKSTKELHNNDDDEAEENVEITTHKKDMYHQKKDNKLMMIWG